MGDMEVDVLPAPLSSQSLLGSLPRELLALIFSLVQSPRDRCSFYQSCKAVNQNGDINRSLAKLVLVIEEETRQENLLADLVAFKRPLRELVLCSRAPSLTSSTSSTGANLGSSSGNMFQRPAHAFKWSPALREPRDAHSLLVDLALATGQEAKARARLAAASTLVLQGWALGTIPQGLLSLLEHCSGLRHLHFQGCMISLRLEPLFLCSHLEHQLQSLSLRTCHINCGAGLTTLDFIGRLQGLSSLELSLQGPMPLKRTEEPGRRACVSLWALSSLVNLRTLAIYYDDTERPMSSHVAGPVGCFAGIEGVARHCTRLTHLTFMGDIYERPAFLLQQAIAEGHAFPSLQSIALPATSANAIASLLCQFPRPLEIRGEVGIRLPISRPTGTDDPWPELLDPEDPPSPHSPLEQDSIRRLLQLQQLRQQLLGEHTWQSHQAGVWGRRHVQQRYIADETTRRFVQDGAARNLSRAEEAKAASLRLVEQIKEVEQQMVPLRHHVPGDLFKWGHGRGHTVGAAASALAAKATAGMATSLSLKPHWPSSKRGMLEDGGNLIRALSPLSSHVLHLCVAHLLLDGPDDAVALVASLPRLQSLRLEHCKLQPAIGTHLDLFGNEQPGRDGGLATIMKGLTSLTKLELLGGEVEDGTEVLDAAAKASSLVSSRRTSRASPLPRLHLKCVGVQGLNAVACTREWSQRQEAYTLFEDEPMRVTLTIIE